MRFGLESNGCVQQGIDAEMWEILSFYKAFMRTCGIFGFCLLHQIMYVINAFVFSFTCSMRITTMGTCAFIHLCRFLTSLPEWFFVPNCRGRAFCCNQGSNHLMRHMTLSRKKNVATSYVCENCFSSSEIVFQVHVCFYFDIWFYNHAMQHTTSSCVCS